MKKVLARCLVLALALCLVCSSCFAEAGYEAIKEYLNNSSAGEGISGDIGVNAGSSVTLCFFFDDCSMWLFGVNAQGEREGTAWYPSGSAFLEVMEDCVGHWDELSSYPSDGYKFVIGIQTTEGGDPLYITDADSAKEIYDILSSD